MKSRFTTVDIQATICELRQRFLSMRVANVYDIDNKTYLIKLVKPDMKAMILLESGIRLHSTEFAWPKNMSPSGFSMKMRKHLRTRRLEKIEQLGVDRIVDMQFGSSEAAYHIILELYDRGNIVLTDFEYNILNILRPRTDDSQDVRFAVRERYPVEGAKQPEGPVSQEKVMSLLLAAKEGDTVKKILTPHLIYGPAVIEHALLCADIKGNARLGKEFLIHEDMPKLMLALQEAELVLEKINRGGSQGFIIQKAEKKPVLEDGAESDELLTYAEFHPYLYKQHDKSPRIELATFDKAVDEFFSQIGSQKLDMKTLQQEKAAMKKLDNFKRDHLKRLDALQKEQDVDAKKAQLIEINLELVDKAILVVRSAIANQIDWTEIHNIVKEAQLQGDPVAGCIKGLRLDANHVTMLLKAPFTDSDDDLDGTDDNGDDDIIKPMKVDIDLGLSAYANARKYYDKKRQATKKEHKTIEASEKAYKSAERKTKMTLKEVQITATISKARKTYWFEKFLWFISSENYLVIGGRDQQTNELIVKRYMTPGDLYVHADLHGASSCIIKNPTGEPVPPKTLNEAGTMAICNSAAWDAKVVTSAWYVHHDQVSKTAPTGEYLSTGSFMIRGKKNYLPPSYLVYGFAILFKVDEDSLFRHLDERKVRTLEDEKDFDEGAVGEDQSVTTETADISEEDGVSGDSDSEDDTSRTAQKDPDVPGDAVTMETGAKVNDAVAAETLGESRLVDGDQAKARENVTSRGETGASKTEADVTVPEAAASVPQEPEEADEECAFPDTEIGLQHIKGEQFTLQTSLSTTSARSSVSEDAPDAPSGEKKSAGRLSAKQRRELKKKAKREVSTSEGSATVTSDTPTPEVTSDTPTPEVTSDTPTPEATSDTPTPEVTSDTPTPEVTSDTPTPKVTSDTPTPEVTSETPTAETSQGRLQGKEDSSKAAAGGGSEEVLAECSQSAGPQQAPPKRGQRAKLKKIREKYADQDEEERQLRMEILASAGPQKEVKIKKGKKGKLQRQQQRQLQQQQQQKLEAQQPLQQGRQGHVYPPRKLTVEDIRSVTQTTTEVDAAAVKPADVDLEVAVKDEEDPASDEEKQAVLDEENVAASDDNILNSLSGIPDAEDGLLFSIAVCAPYSAIINYKYKVKLTPGSTKRGKAAKTALHTFLHDRSTTPREKDLLKSLKDVDIARNIPGRVKVSAPNLLKQKRK